MAAKAILSDAPAILPSVVWILELGKIMANSIDGNSTEPTERKTLIFGCGYLGKEIGRQLLRIGDNVWGSTRCRENGKKLSNMGINPIISDWNDPRTLRELDSFSHVVIAVSRGRNAQKSYWETLVGGLNLLLPRLSGAENVVYISSTGVYHQKNGVWVDETSPTHPTRQSAKAHLAAENVIRRKRSSSSWNVLRLAGIYGFERVPNQQQLRKRIPIQADPNSYINLIHVEDAAQAVIAALGNSNQRTYVVSDDQPTQRRDYYSFITKHLGLAEPIFTTEGTSDSKLPRSEGNKRVWNRRMKSELLPKLRYPTHVEGLPPLLK